MFLRYIYHKTNSTKIQLKFLGGRSFRGSKNQKSGKFHELPGKLIHFFNPPSEDGEREGRTGGRGQEGRGRQPQAGMEGGARAKPGNQLFWTFHPHVDNFEVFIHMLITWKF